MWLCVHLDVVCQLSLNKTGKKTNDVQAKDILGEQIGCHHILESCCIEEVGWLTSFSRPPEKKWVKVTKINFTSKLKKKRFSKNSLYPPVEWIMLGGAINKLQRLQDTQTEKAGPVQKCVHNFKIAVNFRLRCSTLMTSKKERKRKLRWSHAMF